MSAGGTTPLKLNTSKNVFKTGGVMKEWFKCKIVQISSNNKFSSAPRKPPQANRRPPHPDPDASTPRLLPTRSADALLSLPFKDIHAHLFHFCPSPASYIINILIKFLIKYSYKMVRCQLTLSFKI